MSDSDQKNSLYIQHTMWLEILDALYFLSAAFLSCVCHKAMGHIFWHLFSTLLTVTNANICHS
jgi:hypothetical protein